MRYTLSNGDELLGHAELEPMAGPLPGSLSGAFQPERAFETVWPAFRAVQEMTSVVMEIGLRMPPDLSALEIHEYLRAQPEMTVVVAAQEAVRALGLTVRDAAGNDVPNVDSHVSEWRIPLPPDATVDQRATMARHAMMAGMVLDGPQYHLTVIPRTPVVIPSGARSA
jgi:hypothetical protein